MYGISWNIYDEFDNFVRRFEKTYSSIMTPLQVLEIKEEYEKLTVRERKLATLRFYTSCVSTYDVVGTSNFMCWFPLDVKTLKSLFFMNKVNKIK